MSLRWRLALATAGLVALTLALAWVVTGQAVLRPFAAAVFSDFIRQSVHVAERVEQGAAPGEVAAQTGLDLSMLPAPPDRASRQGRGRDEAWRRRDVEGRAVMYRPGARSVVAVETARGWVVVRRELDVDAPARRVGLALIGLTAMVGLAAGGLAGMATRPLETARRAMERVAEGELGHRLEVRGPPELASAARSFNAMAERVEAMLRREKELMAGISHELRTPLTRLGLELELLRDAGVPERRLDAMAGDLDEMERLIQEMIALSRLALGQEPLHLRPTSLRALVEEALAAHPLPDRAVVIEGEGGALALDRPLMLRALGNLLKNVERYTPPGSEVTLRVEAAAVEVMDRGPGVPEASLPRLFEPFYRVDASRARATGGLGLGLMIVDQAARLHGGHASARLREGGGLVVRLDLSATQADAP